MRWQSIIISPKFLAFLGVLWLILAAVIVTTEFGRSPTIEISWATETEFDTAGFNIYRDTDPQGSFSYQVNKQLIPSEAEADAGATYTFVDNNVQANITYYYRLEDVEINNVRQQHDIFQGQASVLSANIIYLAIASTFVGLILIFISRQSIKKTYATS